MSRYAMLIAFAGVVALASLSFCLLEQQRRLDPNTSTVQIVQSLDGTGMSGGPSVVPVQDLQVTPARAGSQPLKNAADAQKLCEGFLTEIDRGDFDKAYELMMRHSWLPEKEVMAVKAATQKQLPALAPRFGRIVGHEFIRKETAGASLIRLVYITKFENHVLRWRFLFYNSGKGWLVNTFSYDDKIQEMF